MKISPYLMFNGQAEQAFANLSDGALKIACPLQEAFSQNVTAS